MAIGSQVPAEKVGFRRGRFVVQIEENEFGFEIVTPKFFAFFGKRSAQLPSLQKKYPQFEFLQLKQVHGCGLMERSAGNKSDRPEGDAHWTSTSQLGLCISTADCIPVLIYNSHQHSVAAVHAGWRGVAQKIVPLTLMNELKSGASPQHLTVLIGPHIQKKSFEIEEPVLQQLLPSFSKDSELITDLGKGKFLLDLNSLLKSQLEKLEIPSENIFTLFLDTKSDLLFHSFRRDKDASGRQLSFICLL